MARVLYEQNPPFDIQKSSKTSLKRCKTASKPPHKLENAIELDIFASKSDRTELLIENGNNVVRVLCAGTDSTVSVGADVH